MSTEEGPTAMDFKASKGRRTLRKVRDEGVAMVVTVMMMLVMAALSILLLGMVVSQVAPNQFAQKNTTTIFAAEAGVEAALGQIRTAAGAADFTGAVYGDTTKLPCTINGTVDASGSTTRYGATVRYFNDDPSGKDEGWLDPHKIACDDATGTGSVQPAFALIESKGATTIASSKVAESAGQRAISMVYQFETTSTNISGGRIYSWSTGTPGFCLRASGTTSGSTVTYIAAVDCGTAANDEKELWVYDTEYTLKLASSTLTATPLCMTDTLNEPNKHVIKLLACHPATYNQLWAWDKDGRATWVGQTSDTNDNGTCLTSGRTSGDPAANATLKAGTCANQNAWGSFSPDPSVGPGAASVNTRQIVNYLEFGRCFDVTDTKVNTPFMISYPCKQDPPDSKDLFWNHKWFYEEPLTGTTAAAQLIYVKPSESTKYCLETPTSVTDPAFTGVGPGRYVTLNGSCNLTTARQQWTRNTATGDRLTSYTIQDFHGQCVGVSADSRYNGNWSALVVSTCDGSIAQKWNAPAETVEAEVGNYLEEAK